MAAEYRGIKMAIPTQLRLRQAHSLALTPQLIQSIRLLQMTAVELEHFIDAELENNPLLERMETGNSSGDVFSAFGSEDMEKGGQNAEDAITGMDSMVEIFDFAFENAYSDDPVREADVDFTPVASLSPVSAGHSHAEIADMALLVTEKPTMRDHLYEQIIFAFHDPAERIIAVDLSEQIDESGYFTGGFDEVSKRFSVNYEVIERIFFRLQNFEPAGIFARDLAECLALQLERRGQLTPAMEILLKNLPALARRDFVTLARICGVEQHDVMNMLEEIRFLDPKPATIWSAAVPGVIMPDAFVTENQDGTFHVELNSAILPALAVNRTYSLDVCANRAEREFFSTCQQHANWLLRALDQRAKTLLKVISEVVRHQQVFLREGIIALQPLNQAIIAKAVGMHESTVSRVTSHKYIATPRGIFELRSFFSTRLGAGAGCQSADAIRFQIRHMIEAETADNILSDDAIVEHLRAEGIDIARRTVAKYRESMHIASSVMRRRTKKYGKQQL